MALLTIINCISCIRKLWWTLKNHSTLFHTVFYSKTERIGNYLIQGNFVRKKLRGFFEISSLFPYEMFFWPKFFIPHSKLSLPKKVCPTNTFSRDTLIYVKIFRIDIPLGNSRNDYWILEWFLRYLKDNAYKNAFSLLFHRIRFNGSWK